MILKGKELFLIVDSLFNRICVICNTKEEAEKELKKFKKHSDLYMILYFKLVE